MHSASTELETSVGRSQDTQSPVVIAILLTAFALGACSPLDVQIPPVDKGDVQVINKSAERGMLDSPVALYGVDFSGQRERKGRNTKLWIAAWNPSRRQVELHWGGADPGFTRAGLATKIVESPGYWVIDFPFGLQVDVAGAMSLADWPAYLDWTHQGAHSAEQLWQMAKSACQTTGVNCHARRAIDLRTHTTWDPLNLRLFRQTLRGAADVLRTLNRAAPNRVRILPWDDPGDPNQIANVVEGFPGYTLARLALPRSGYKGPGQARSDQRDAIMQGLRKAGLPVPASVAATACADEEGDALDALVLLFAAWQTSLRPASDWQQSRATLVDHGRLIEGDFLD